MNIISENAFNVHQTTISEGKLEVFSTVRTSYEVESSQNKSSLMKGAAGIETCMF